jgi:hypothetical protein
MSFVTVIGLTLGIVIVAMAGLAIGHIVMGKPFNRTCGTPSEGQEAGACNTCGADLSKGEACDQHGKAAKDAS